MARRRSVKTESEKTESMKIMKIYLAATMMHCIESKMGGQINNILLSYWDWIGPIPFRKPTFRYLILTLPKEKPNGKKINKNRKQ